MEENIINLQLNLICDQLKRRLTKLRSGHKFYINLRIGRRGYEEYAMESVWITRVKTEKRRVEINFPHEYDMKDAVNLLTVAFQNKLLEENDPETYHRLKKLTPTTEHNKKD